MSRHITYRLSEDEYTELMKVAGGKSANLKARELLLESLFSTDKNSELSLKISLRILTILQQYIGQTSDETTVAKVFNLAFDDENVLLQKMGMSPNE